MNDADHLDQTIHKWEGAWNSRCEQRVIMFVDMVGSTSIKGQSGAQRGLWFVREHNRVVRDAINARISGLSPVNGRPAAYIVKYVGDEVMASFAAEHAALAINCAIDALSELASRAPAYGSSAIRSKVGIAAGEVVPFLYDDEEGIPDPHGEPVDMAARLVAMADAGQILVDQGCRELVAPANLHAPSGQRPEFRPTPGVSKRLKGIKKEVVVSEVVWGGTPNSGQIRNLQLLRAEAKELEEALTDVGEQREHRLHELLAALEKGNIAGHRDAIDQLESLDRERYGALLRVRKVYDKGWEIKEDQRIRRLFDDLDRSYQQALDCVKAYEYDLLASPEPSRRNEAVGKCYDAARRFFRVAADLQIASDTLVREIDGT